jgi:hypothetical protein
MTTHLLTLTSAHKRWLSALVVNVGPEVLSSWLRRRLSFLNGLVDHFLGSFVDGLYARLIFVRKKMLGVTRLKLHVGCDAPFFKVALETADRILR